MEAIFESGKPVMVPHTPSSAVAAGDVVVVGSDVRIAHLDIAAGALGDLAAGGGVYDVAKDASDMSDGDTLYWDAAEGNTTLDPSGNNIYGRALEDAGTSATRVKALHDPSANGS